MVGQLFNWIPSKLPKIFVQAIQGREPSSVVEVDVVVFHESLGRCFHLLLDLLTTFLYVTDGEGTSSFTANWDPMSTSEWLPSMSERVAHS